MSNLSNVIEDMSYTLVINSSDKITGTNNNSTYYVNFDSFLPQTFNKYRVNMCFQTNGGYYKDGTYNSTNYIFSTAKVFINLNSKKYSYDTSTKSSSLCAGLIQRDQQTSTSASNTLSCFYLQNPSFTIERPYNNSVGIQVYNSYLTNVLLTDTNAAGTALAPDMSSYTLIMEFIPIKTSTNAPKFDV